MNSEPEVIKTGIKDKDRRIVITGSGKIKLSDLLTMNPEAKNWFYLSFENSSTDLFWCNLLFTNNLFVGEIAFGKPSAC